MVNVDPAELDLLKPDGSHAIPAPVTVTSAGAWMQTVTLTVNGVYKILLDPQLANVGSADVQLFNVPADLSGPITPGTPLTVTTTAPGQNAIYTFNGVKDQRVSLNLTAVYDLEPQGLRPEARRHESHREDRRHLGRLRRARSSSRSAASTRSTVDPQSSFYGSVTVGLYVVPADTTGTLTLGTPQTLTTTVPGQNATLDLRGYRRPAHQLQLHGRDDGEGQDDREGAGTESPRRCSRTRSEPTATSSIRGRCPDAPARTP